MAELIQRAIARRAQQIRAQRFGDRERITTPPELEHHLLRDVFGGHPLGQKTWPERGEMRVVRGEYGIERGWVARLQSLEKGAIVHVVPPKVRVCGSTPPVPRTAAPVYSNTPLVIRIRVVI